MTIAAIVLAAGASRRLGYPKQLVAHRGEPLVRAIARVCLGSRCDRVGVVLGARADRIAPVLADLPVAIVDNPGWAEGVASSIRAGIAWAAAADAVVLCTCDQRALTAAHLDALVAAFRAHGGAAASGYAGVLGVPAVFGRAHFAALAALRGDRGARDLLAGAAEVAWPAGAGDLDTADDLGA